MYACLSIIVPCKCFIASKHNNYRSTIYLVFEFCEHDLAGLLSNTQVVFNLSEIKQVIKQILNGIYFIHQNKVNIFFIYLIKYIL